MRSIAITLGLLIFTGCGPGGEPGEENQPDLSIDSDGDGLTDGQELELGTDPAKVDTDGDGYWDSDEINENHDPLDPEDRIYIGHWPYNPNKDTIEDPGWESTPSGPTVVDGVPVEGTVIPRFLAQDQYGEIVDLYDFAHQGRNIAIEVGTRFCSPCKGLAEFYSNGDATVMDEFAWFHPSYVDVRRQIEEDEIFWITVIFTGGEPLPEGDNVWWHEQWPNHRVLVMFDADLQLREYLQVVSMPHVTVIDENMRFRLYDPSSPTKGFNYLVGR